VLFGWWYLLGVGGGRLYGECCCDVTDYLAYSIIVVVERLVVALPCCGGESCLATRKKIVKIPGVFPFSYGVVVGEWRR